MAGFECHPWTCGYWKNPDGLTTLFHIFTHSTLALYCFGLFVSFIGVYLPPVKFSENRFWGLQKKILISENVSIFQVLTLDLWLFFQLPVVPNFFTCWPKKKIIEFSSSERSALVECEKFRFRFVIIIIIRHMGYKLQAPQVLRLSEESVEFLRLSRIFLVKFRVQWFYR